MICPIFIKDTADVEKVSRIAAETGVDMSVSYGSMMTDPRSILGLFAFIGKKALLVAPDDFDPEKFAKVVKRM